MTNPNDKQEITIVITDKDLKPASRDDWNKIPGVASQQTPEVSGHYLPIERNTSRTVNVELRGDIKDAIDVLIELYSKHGAKQTRTCTATRDNPRIPLELQCQTAAIVSCPSEPTARKHVIFGEPPRRG